MAVAAKRRAAMPAQVPRAVKRRAGRTVAEQTPAFIRAVGTPMSALDRDYLRQKLAARLAKFAPSIERVSVRIEDVNGPRGGVDKRCRVKVVLSGLPSVAIEEQHATLRGAMDGALARVTRAVRQALQRRRTLTSGKRRTATTRSATRRD